jgi:DNA polymerase-3 subunit epsilon
LLIDAGSSEGEGQGGAIELEAIDFSAFDLLVIQPSVDEAEAFEKALADLDKASGGKSLWKSLEAVL